MTPRLARRLLRLIARLVPSGDRRGWLQEWDAELATLQRRRDRGKASRVSTLGFLLGTLPHSLWERKEWTMSVLLQDVRYAVRVLVRSPGFTLLAVLTVALGIGAGTTIFSLVNATLLQSPAGVREPERLVQIGRDRSSGFDNLSWDYVDTFAESAESLDGVAAYSGRAFLVGSGAETRATPGEVVSGEYFDVLGVQPAAGRLLQPADDAPGGGSPVVVISARLRQERFGDDEAVGRDLRVNGRDLRVVGVAPREFRGPDVVGSAPELWVPLSLAPSLMGPRYESYTHPGFSWLWAVGRLREGTGVAQARGELSTLYTARFENNWGEVPDEPLGVVTGIGLRPDERVPVRRLMALLLAIVVVVMAVASANLGNMMLARGSSRLRELGIRSALGAGNARILRQLVTESVLVALVGGALALVATRWSARMLPLFLPVGVAPEFTVDATVLAFGLGCSLAVGALFGLLPGLRIVRGDLTDALREGTRQAGRGGGWLRKGLVVGQLALSFTLLAGTVLLVQSIRNAESADPGYNTRNVLTVTVDLDLAGYDELEGRGFLGRALPRLRALPGTAAVGSGSEVPFGGWSRWGIPWPETAARPAGAPEFLELDVAQVSPGYFEALEIPVLAGDVEAAGRDAPRALILSESAARLLVPDGPAVGSTLALREDEEPFQVTAVVADVQNRSLRSEPLPSIYRPASQSYSGRTTFFVRAERDAESLAAPVRQALLELDPGLGILSVRTLQDRMGRSLQETVLVSRTAVAFGLLAAALAAVGLYGVVAYLASQRTHEVGVRMALGARPADVVGLVLRQGAVLALTGLALGVALSLASGGLLDSLVYGLSPRDPLLLGLAALALTVVALAAAGVPALRATRVDPVDALRDE